MVGSTEIGQPGFAFRTEDIESDRLHGNAHPDRVAGSVIAITGPGRYWVIHLTRTADTSGWYRGDGEVPPSSAATGGALSISASAALRFDDLDSAERLRSRCLLRARQLTSTCSNISTATTKCPTGIDRTT
jgi:hypothetical protein